MEDALHKLPSELLAKVQNVIDGNQVEGKELCLVSSKVEPFKLLLTVQWEFYASWSDKNIAGGSASSNHYGYGINNFKKYHEQNIRRACNDLSLRKSFLVNLNNAGIEGLLSSKTTTEIANLGTHSYSYDCNHCNARGIVTCGGCGGSGSNGCYGCGGSGRKQEFYTEYNSYSKQSISRSRWVNCGSCGGAGSVTCSGCGGRGNVRCPTCSGHQFFTTYRTTDAVAEPKSHYQVTGNLYAAEIANELARQGHEFTFSKVCFTHHQTNSPEVNLEQFLYHANSYATQIIADLRSEHYTIAGLGEPVYPFIRPPIFDQLLKEEIAELLQIKEQKGKIRKESAIKFFDHFIDQPVLSEALKNISKQQSKNEIDASHIIVQACEGFISQQASQTFSYGVTAILDKVSPKYHGLTWTLWQIFSAIFILLWTEIIFEHALLGDQFSWYKLLSFSLHSLFGLVIFYTTFSIFIIVISAMIISYKRRNIPEEYRQSMRHGEIFKKSFKAGIVFWLIGGAYGSFAHQQAVPQLNYQPFTAIYKILTTDELKKKFDENCSFYFKNITYNPRVCDYIKSQTPSGQISIEQKFRMLQMQSINSENTTEEEKIYAIQNILNQTYPEIVTDGKFGSNTRAKSIDFLRSQFIPIKDDASKAEIIEAFKLIQ